MGQAQINVRTRACSRASIARTKQAALTHNVRGKELKLKVRQLPLINWPYSLDNILYLNHTLLLNAILTT